MGAFCRFFGNYSPVAGGVGAVDRFSKKNLANIFCELPLRIDSSGGASPRRISDDDFSTD